MGLNLIDLLKGQLGNAVAGQIGKSLGIGEKAASSGLDALIPVILGKVIQQTSTKSGAEDFSRTLDRDELRGGGLLDNIGDIFGGGKKQEQVSGLGGTLVKALFGDKLGAFLPLLSKLLGIDSGKSSSLLGMLVPIVFSFLSKQKSQQNLDPMGFANLLGSQKDIIAKAMPAGFSDALGLASILPSGGSSSRPSGSRPSQAQTSSSGGGGFARLLIPLLIAAALAYFGYQYFNRGAEKAKDVVEGIAEKLPEVPEISIPKFDLPDFSGLKLPEEAGELSSVFGKFNEAFQDVKDEASAKLAIPKFENLNAQFDSFSGKLGSLPEAVQSAVKSGVGGYLEPIQKLIDQIYAIPGVKSILEPLLNATIAKIKGLAGM